MSNIINYIKSLFWFFAFSSIIICIIIPIPIEQIEYLIYLQLVLSLSLFVSRFFKFYKSHLFLQVLMLFCLLNCSLFVASARTFLTIQTIEEHIEPIRLLGMWICRENSICGFFTTIFLCYAILFLCKYHIKKTDEFGSKKILDKQTKEMIENNKKMIEGIITQTELLEKNIKIDKKTNIELTKHAKFISSCKYVTTTINAFIFIFIVIICGGIAVGILEFHLNWQTALNQYIILSSGYLVIFIIPFFCAAFSF